MDVSCLKGDSLMVEAKLKVQWLVNIMGFGKARFSLGFCEKQPYKIAFVSPEDGMTALLPLVMRDLYIKARGCEEATRCLVLHCPLNRTTFTSYINSAIWKRVALVRKKNFEILLNRVSEWQLMLVEEIDQLDWESDLTYLYEPPPIVLRRKSTRSPIQE